MKASTHIVPALGVDADKAGGRRSGTGIATAALRVAEQLGEPADLVLIAVPAGRGRALLDELDGPSAAHAV